MDSTFGVLYSTEHGSYEIPNAIYNNYVAEKQLNGNTEICAKDCVPRDDPLIVSFARDYLKINKYTHNIGIAEVSQLYKDCWFVFEYDGKENVRVDINKYTLMNILQITQNPLMSAEVKIEAIADINKNINSVKSGNSCLK